MTSAILVAGALCAQGCAIQVEQETSDQRVTLPNGTSTEVYHDSIVEKDYYYNNGAAVELRDR